MKWTECGASLFCISIFGEMKRGTLTKWLFCLKTETKVTGNLALIEK